MFEKGLSIIIPCYNEASRLDLKGNIESVLNYLKRHDFKNYELILVDDHSVDNTLEVLKQFNNYNTCRVYSNARNSGKGYSIRKGMFEAIYDYILYMDADLSVPLENIAVFCSMIADNTCIIASRYLPNSTIVNQRSKLRRLMSTFTRIFLIKLCGLSVSDSQCGFKMFKFNEGMYPDSLEPSRWLFDIELLRYLK